MTEVKEDAIVCNSVTAKKGSRFYAVIESSGFYMVAHVEFSGIRNKDSIVLTNPSEKTRYIISPLSIVEIGDSLWDMEAGKKMTDNAREKINRNPERKFYIRKEKSKC